MLSPRPISSAFHILIYIVYYNNGVIDLEKLKWKPTTLIIASLFEILMITDQFRLKRGGGWGRNHLLLNTYSSTFKFLPSAFNYALFFFHQASFLLYTRSSLKKKKNRWNLRWLEINLLSLFVWFSRFLTWRAAWGLSSG